MEEEGAWVCVGRGPVTVWCVEEMPVCCAPESDYLVESGGWGWGGQRNPEEEDSYGWRCELVVTDAWNGTGMFSLVCVFFFLTVSSTPVYNTVPLILLWEEVGCRESRELLGPSILSLTRTALRRHHIKQESSPPFFQQWRHRALVLYCAYAHFFTDQLTSLLKSLSRLKEHSQHCHFMWWYAESNTLPRAHLSNISPHGSWEKPLEVANYSGTQAKIGTTAATHISHLTTFTRKLAAFSFVSSSPAQPGLHADHAALKIF